MSNLMSFFRCSEISYKLHRYSFVLRCKRRPQCDTYRYFFSYRIISAGNLLPKSVVSSSTLAAFKTRLRKLDLHDVCHLTYYCLQLLHATFSIITELHLFAGIYIRYVICLSVFLLSGTFATRSIVLFTFFLFTCLCSWVLVRRHSIVFNT